MHEGKGKSYSFTTLLSEAVATIPTTRFEDLRGLHEFAKFFTNRQSKLKFDDAEVIRKSGFSFPFVLVVFPRYRVSIKNKRRKKRKKKRNERIKKEKYAQQSEQPRLVSGMEGRWKNEKFMKRRLLKRETARAGRWRGNKKQRRRWQRGRNGRSTPGFEKIQSSLCSGPPEKPTIFIFASKALGNQGLFLQRPQRTSNEKKEARRDDGLTSVVANENYVRRRF